MVNLPRLSDGSSAGVVAPGDERPPLRNTCPSTGGMDAGLRAHTSAAPPVRAEKRSYAGLHDPPASDKRPILTTTGKMNETDVRFGDVQFGDGFVFTHCVGRNV